MNKYPQYLYRNLNLARRGFASGINYSDPKNPKVFMKVTRDGTDIGRMVFEVTFFIASLVK